MAELILIVEDEPDLVKTLEYNLQREGYQTRSALDGQTGMKRAALEPIPDLILLDLMLPDISGIEVCRRLKPAAPTKEVPVLMHTPKGEEIDRGVGFEVGADDYVVKPFSVRELLLRIKAILRRVHADGTLTKDYIHVEALLVKRGTWQILMEYQKSKGTEQEWNALP